MWREWSSIARIELTTFQFVKLLTQRLERMGARIICNDKVMVPRRVRRVHALTGRGL